MSDTPIHSLAELASAARNDCALNDTLMAELVTYCVQTLREYLGTNSLKSLNELTPTALSHHAMQLKGEFAPKADNFTVTQESKDEVFHMAEEYWRGRYQHFRDWAIATHKGETPPESALNPQDITGEDVAGFMLFGAPHPLEVDYLLCDTPQTRMLESRANDTLRSYFTYEGYLQACAAIRPEYELGRMPEHLIKMIQRGEVTYKEIHENTKKLCAKLGSLSLLLQQNPEQPFTETRSEIIALLEKPFHPTYKPSFSGSNNLLPRHSVFNALLICGFDQQVQTLLKDGHVKPDDINIPFASCMHAVKKADCATIKAMMEAGFEFRSDDQISSSATDQNNLIKAALEKERFDVAAFLARSGVNAIAIVDSNDKTLLHQWAECKTTQPQAQADALIALLEQGAGKIFSLDPRSSSIMDHVGKVTHIDYTEDDHLSSPALAKEEKKNARNENTIFEHIETYRTRLEGRFTQFIQNAETLRQPYGDQPLADGLSPATLTRQDVIDFYTINKLPEMMDSRYWVYAQDRLDDLLNDESAPLPKHIANEIRALRQPNTAELARTEPPKPFESWASTVSQPQAERARA